MSPAGVSDDAKFEIKGEFFFAQPEGSDLKQVRIDFRIRNRVQGGTLDSGDLFISLDSTKTIARILQPTVRLEPDERAEGGSKVERNKKLQQADNPKTRSVFVEGTEIKSEAGSPYSIEVLAKEVSASGEPMPLTPHVKEGQAFVDLMPGQVYEVKLTNRTREPVAASLSIDGLSDFHFAEGK